MDLTGLHDLDADQVHQAITAAAGYREALLTTLTEATIGLIEAQADRYHAPAPIPLPAGSPAGPAGPC